LDARQVHATLLDRFRLSASEVPLLVYDATSPTEPFRALNT
jgi:hypothetical protein